MRLTYGQLIDAANAKRSEQWDHTSHLLALIYNINTSAKSRKLNPDDFHPLKVKVSKGSNYTADKVVAEFNSLCAEKPIRKVKISQSQVIE